MNDADIGIVGMALSGILVGVTVVISLVRHLGLERDVLWASARALGQRTIKEGGNSPEERTAFMFRLVTARLPSQAEQQVLVAAYHDHLSHYQADEDAARKLIAVGPSQADAAMQPAELAAWTMLANLILNLDEAIMKN